MVAASPTRSQLNTVLRRPIKAMRVQSGSTGAPIEPWWSTPARRPHGGSSGWNARCRLHIARSNPSPGPLRSRHSSAVPRRKPRRRSSVPCPPPIPLGDVPVEERPGYGRGRPSAPKPRPVQALRERLKTTMRLHTACSGRREAEAGGFVLRTTMPTAGPLAQSASDSLTVYTDHHGPEQHDGLLTDPVIIKSLLLKKPARSAALGRICWLALLLWRVMARPRRQSGDITSTPLTGWRSKRRSGRPPA